MHGGMLERDRSVGWRTGPTRVPLTITTTDERAGSLRQKVIRHRRNIGWLARIPRQLCRPPGPVGPEGAAGALPSVLSLPWQADARRSRTPTRASPQRPRHLPRGLGYLAREAPSQLHRAVTC